MRVRNRHDYEGMSAVGALVAAVLDELRDAVRPGLTTGDLDRLAGNLLAARKARPTPMRAYAYPGNLCISVNDEVVHGVPGKRVLREGDLVKLDLTADMDGYVADATRMVAIPPVADIVTRLADCATEACMKAIGIVKPGLELARLGSFIERHVADCGFLVVKDLCGHGVGRETHENPEVPNYYDQSNTVRLVEGDVITIEPIIIAAKAPLRELDDGWTLTTAGILSAHYEETILVEPDRAKVLTA